jgi:outer membrane protein TolC
MKMKQLTIAGWLIVLACLPRVGWGQAAQVKDTLHINLQQALDIALSDNPTILIANKEIERVDYSKKSAWYGLLPSLSGSAQYTRNVQLQTMALAGSSMKIGQDNTVNFGLSLSLPLIVPALWHSIQLTTIEMQMAAEKARASKITLHNDVTKAYYNILLAQDSYKSLQDGYDVARQNYEEAKKRFDLGLAAEYDYISAEVQMNNLLPTLLQVETGITQAKMYLKVLMGVDMSVPLAVKGALQDFETNISGLNSERSISLGNNTDLQQLEIQQKQLQKSLLLQRTQRLPSLVGFGNFQYQGMGDDDDKTGVDFMTGQPTVVPGGLNWYDPSLAVGLQLNIPLTGIFTDAVKEKQIKIQRKELALQRDYLESSLSVQAHTALDNMDKAVKQMEASKKGVTLSEKAHNISAKRYETGAGTMLELQSAALALTQSRLSYHQAIADYLNAKADYEKLVGSGQ